MRRKQRTWMAMSAVVLGLGLGGLVSPERSGAATSLTCALLPVATLSGSDAGETLTGSDTAEDSIFSLGGDDAVRPLGRNDCVQAGDGNDSVYGGDGDDWLAGGAGNDALTGDAGDDKIFGDAGRDTLSGSDGNDYIVGTDGATDTVDCGAGTDVAILDPGDLAMNCEVVDRPGLTPAPNGVGVRQSTILIGATGATFSAGQLGDGAMAALNPFTGSLDVREIDATLGVDGAGAAVWAMERWYDSALAGRGRDVGLGWTTGSGYDVRLELQSDASVVFVAASQARYAFAPQSDGTYAPTDQTLDTDATLARTADGGYDVTETDLDQTLHFDSYGKLVTARDNPSGSTVTSTYSQTSTRIRLATATDQANRRTSFGTDASGALTSLVAPSGTGTYHYSSGLLHDVTTPAGVRTDYGYDAAGRLAALDRSDRHVVITYDSTGRLARLQDGGSAITATYPAPDTTRCGTSATRETDVTIQPLNATVKYCFDSTGALLAKFIADTQPPATPTPDFSAVYDAASDRTLVQWNSATDPALFDGSPGSGVSQWQVRVRHGSGTWSTRTVNDPSVLIAGGRVGESVGVEVTYSDNAGNVATPLTASPTSTSFVSDESSDIACQPSDVGYAPGCVDGSAQGPSDDAAAEPGVTLEQTGSSTARSAAAAPDPSTSCFPDACVIHVSNRGWATVRNRPQQYVLGNVHDGARFQAKRATQANDSGGPSYYYGGYVSGTYNNCGWIKTTAAGSGLSTGFDGGCNPPSFGDFSGSGGPEIAVFAAGVNCQRLKTGNPCADGYPVKVKRTTERWRNLNPNPMIRIDSAHTSRYGTDGAGPVAKDQTVYWRYTSIDDREWVLVRYGTRAGGRTNWFFVKRDDLNPICKRGGCRPKSE